MDSLVYQVSEQDFQYKGSTKRQRRKIRKTIKNKQTNFMINYIEAITDNQEAAFDSFYSGQNMLLHGVAGTGKTFISLYLALKDVLTQSEGKEKVTIVRSVVPTRDMGFLPGNAKEKAKIYESPYYAICTELFGRGDAYDVLKAKNMVEFISTSYVRGITLSNSIVIVDECQNLTFHELDSIITRVGENCRILFCGDFRQSDLERDYERKGVLDFIKVIQKMKSFDFVEFDKQDIVRSPLVKEYIISKLDNGIHS